MHEFSLATGMARKCRCLPLARFKYNCGLILKTFNAQHATPDIQERRELSALWN